MDNLTHTLVGLVVGEMTARSVRNDPQGLDRDTKRNLIVGLMVIGSNVPDLDFIPSRISGSKLDYLLQHRGHTHTIIGAIVCALFLLAACDLWCRWRRHTLSHRDRAQLGGVALIALLLHIALDSLNSYGVHPFWPFDNRWFYGDAVFIVEPLCWAACAPLVFVLRSAYAKAFVAFALIAGPTLSMLTRIVPPFLCATLVVFTIVMLALGKFLRDRSAVAVALAACIGINALFIWSGEIAARKVDALGRALDPEFAMLDHALNPLPANPFCWQVILVQRDAADWKLRRGALSITPTLIAATECPLRADAKPTAPMVETSKSADAAIEWRDEIQLSRTELEHWIADDCRAAAFMRFARVPWIAQIGEMRVIGDLRFDNEPGLSFAEIDLDDPRERCDRSAWIEPRRDLLDSRHD